MDKSDEVIIRKILREIDFLQNSVKNYNYESFLRDEILKRAVSMAFLNIGELARHTSKELKEKATDIPFKEIIATRNNAAHGYDSLRFDFLWETIKQDLPSLKSEMKKLLKNLEN